jgi:hypothetical protein
MVRSWAIILGVGLGILWIVGLGSPYAAPWMTWLDGAAAVLAFLVAAMANDQSSLRMRTRAPMALSLGLFVMAIIGMATNGAPFQNGWNFAFAVLFFLVGRAEMRRPAVPATRAGTVKDARDRFRRSA